MVTFSPLTDNTTAQRFDAAVNAANAQDADRIRRMNDQMALTTNLENKAIEQATADEYRRAMEQQPAQQPAMVAPIQTTVQDQSLQAPPSIQPVTMEELNAPTARTPTPLPTIETPKTTTTQAFAPPSQQTNQPVTQPVARSTPFDSPEFQQRLTNRIASMPGGGRELIKIKANRDAMISKIMEMASNGNVDQAKYHAERNGFNIPDAILNNGDMTAAFTFSSKAYPNEPDKGQIFFQAFMNNVGAPLNQRVQAGIAAAGKPENTAQRELNKAMALAEFTQKLKNSTPTPSIDANGNLFYINPQDRTAAPVTLEGTGEPFKASSVKGLRSGSGRSTIMNAGGVLYDTAIRDANGNAVPITNPSENRSKSIERIALHFMKNDGDDEATAMTKAIGVVDQIRNVQGKPTAVRVPTPALPSTNDDPLGIR